jgi:hypothetical protein
MVLGSAGLNVSFACSKDAPGQGDYYRNFADGGLKRQGFQLNEVLARRDADDDYLVAVKSQAQIAGSIKKNHRARMFIDRCLMRNLFDVNVEDPTGRQIDGLRMHQITFEENFDPVTIFSDGDNHAGGILYRCDQFFAVSCRRRFTIETPVGEGCSSLSALCGLARGRSFSSRGFHRTGIEKGTGGFFFEHQKKSSRALLRFFFPLAFFTAKSLLIL